MVYRVSVGDINSRLEAAWLAAERLKKLGRLERASRRDRKRLAEERDRHANVLAKDKRSVEKLEGTSIRSLFYSALGKREARLEDDRESLLASALLHQLIESELIAIEVQLEVIEREREAARDAASRLEQVRSEKEAWLLEHGGPAAEHLFKLSEEIGRHGALVEEMDEAIVHGERALELTDEVLALLSSARNWGVFDMGGGGLLASIAKHGKIDAAKKKQAAAQAALLAFSRELEDVEIQMDSDTVVDLSAFSRFGDMFFDGLIFDWSVQSKINKSHKAVNETREEIASSLVMLEEQKSTLLERVGQAAAQRAEFIEGWGR